ncbi:TM2 domain-containing protein 2-like isoform X2 [Paramacrobiotus metropolitanus]|nr:TM2 domain-containing protein 2-like isoform X2 [Paramacrobiotus metropolitanus]
MFRMKTGKVFLWMLLILCKTSCQGEKDPSSKNQTVLSTKCGADGKGAGCRNVMEVAQEQFLEQPSGHSVGGKVDQMEIKSPQNSDTDNSFGKKDVADARPLAGLSDVEQLSGKKIRNNDDAGVPSADHFADSFHAHGAEFFQYNPYSPVVQCDYLPMEFLECEQPADLQGNVTQYQQQGYGCYTYGGRRWEDVQHSAAWCAVLPGIECFGQRQFLREGFPCVKYTGYSFLSTFLYSLLLGFLGVDRFCLGYTGLGAAKLLTIGGFGVWWFVDIVLLVTGDIMPADGSNWVPDY